MILLKWASTGEFYLYSREQQRCWFIGMTPYPPYDYPIEGKPGEHFRDHEYQSLLHGGLWAPYCDPILQLPEGL